MSDSLQFTIREEGGKFCLFTKDGNKKLGCHDTREEAEAQERAIESQKSAIEYLAHEEIKKFFNPDDDEDGPSRTFLNSLRERLKKLFKSKGSITDKDFNDAVRKARSAAGGKMGARKRKRAEEFPSLHINHLYDIAASELTDEGRTFGEFTLLNQFQFAQVENGQWIPYLPVPGEYESPRYGTIIITRERNKRFMDNFKGGVYQKTIPVDAEHETKISGAMAWIVDMRQNPDGSVDAQVNWTDRGRSMMAEDRFRFFSPEFFDVWTDPATGQDHRDVAIGGALTTRPFFKEDVLRPLVASETGIDAIGDNDEPLAHFERKPTEDTMADDKKENKTFMERVRDAFGFDEDVDDAQIKAEMQAALASDEDADDADNDAGDSGDTGDSDTVIEASERFQAVEAENKKLREDLEEQRKVTTELKNQARAKRFSDIVEGRTENSKNRWFGDPTKNVKRLEALADAVGEDSEIFKETLQREIATANQVQFSELLKERGYQGGSDEPTTVEAKVAAEARKLMSEQPERYPTPEQARTAVWDMHPEWKGEHHARPARR